MFLEVGFWAKENAPTKTNYVLLESLNLILDLQFVSSRRQTNIVLGCFPSQASANSLELTQQSAHFPARSRMCRGDIWKSQKTDPSTIRRRCKGDMGWYSAKLVRISSISDMQSAFFQPHHVHHMTEMGSWKHWS